MSRRERANHKALAQAKTVREMYIEKLRSPVTRFWTFGRLGATGFATSSSMSLFGIPVHERLSLVPLRRMALLPRPRRVTSSAVIPLEAALQ